MSKSMSMFLTKEDYDKANGNKATEFIEFIKDHNMLSEFNVMVKKTGSTRTPWSFVSMLGCNEEPERYMDETLKIFGCTGMDEWEKIGHAWRNKLHVEALGNG